MLTINANGHEVMMHFHRTMDEKRSIVVLKDAEYQHWLHFNHDQARQLLNLDTPRFLKSQAVPR